MAIAVLAGGHHPLLPITLWLHIPELRRDPRLTGNVTELRQQPAWLRAAEHRAATWKSSLPVSKLSLCCESSSMREPDSWDQTGTALPGWCLSAPAEACGGAHAARPRSRWRILLCGWNHSRARLRDGLTLLLLPCPCPDGREGGSPHRMAAITTRLFPHLPPEPFASEKIFASEFLIFFQNMTHPLN